MESLLAIDAGTTSIKAGLFAPDGRCLYATADGSSGAVYLELDLDNYRVSEIG